MECRNPLVGVGRRCSPNQSARRSRPIHILYLIAFIFFLFVGYQNLSFEPKVEVIKSPANVLEYRGIVDSMDGVGYNISERRFLPIDDRYYELEKLPECDLTKDRDVILNNIPKIMKAFKECVGPTIEKYADQPKELAIQWVTETAKCDNRTEFENLRIDAFPNLHEIKWVILPHCREHNTMVTLGVGHDTVGEERVNVTLPNTKFYGADPIIEPNIQLYSAFGQFFPFAVGKKSGMSRFRILPNQNQRTRQYVMQDVTTIEVTYFLKEILGLSRIDIMWMDIEGGEFEFLEFMHRDAKFDKNGIVICQWNAEIHASAWEGGYEVFSKFIKRVLDEGRYMFLKPMETAPGVFRQMFINMEDKQCVRKYIQ